MPDMRMVSYPPTVAVDLFYQACLWTATAIGMACFFLWPWLRAGLRAPGAPVRSTSAAVRNTLAFWLGGLWLVDGLLQAQPLMVTRFIGGLIAPLVQGQPPIVASIVELGMRIWGLNPIWFNVGATFIQLLIGLGLLFSRDGSRVRRLALFVSIVWGLVVWVFGEAFGGLFSGGGMLIGSPGSVLLYVILAGLLLLPQAHWDEGRVLRWMPIGAAGFFALGTGLQLLPANGWWSQGLGTWVTSMATMPQPALLSHLLLGWAAMLKAQPVLWNALLIASGALLAVSWLLRPWSRWTLWASIAWTLLVWVMGQDFGVLGVMGTDPNTGAILLGFFIAFGRHMAAEDDARFPSPAREELRHV